MPPLRVNSRFKKVLPENHIYIYMLVRIALILGLSCTFPMAGFGEATNAPVPFLPAGTIKIRANLSDAQAGRPYQALVTGVGGNKPYQFVAFGLPPGLEINTLSGKIFGKPLTPGRYGVIVFATDLWNFGFRQFYLTVSDVPPIPGLTISPHSYSLSANSTKQFMATLIGGTDLGVRWSVSAGSISNSGLFTPPSDRTTQSVLVTATSVANADAVDHAIVNVIQPSVAEPPVTSGGYKLSLYGPHTLYPGYDSYVELRVTYGGKIGNVFFNEVEAPGGIHANVICTYAPCWRNAGDARIFQWNANQKEVTVLLHFDCAGDLAPGDYEATVRTEVRGSIQSITVPIKVLPLPVLKVGHPAFPPPIPGLGRWQGEMLKLASKWCNPKKIYGFGYENDVWFYDGARVFFQVADYTRDNSWNSCALTIAKQYAAYVISNNGNIPGWRVFPHGLRMAYERTGVAEYKQAAILLAHNSAYAGTGGDINDSHIRETAYVLQAYMQAEKLGQSRNPSLAKSVDYLLGMFEVIFDQGKYQEHQVFYDGLAAAALIEYYQLTGDPRIPPAIKKMLDWVWGSGLGWNDASHCLVSQYQPGGSDSSRAIGTCNTELINLVAPAFAWYYNIAGQDSSYLGDGDEMFSHALDSDISYSGKIFSQNYRWSFDYVYWRTAP